MMAAWAVLVCLNLARMIQTVSASSCVAINAGPTHLQHGTVSLQRCRMNG